MDDAKCPACRGRCQRGHFQDPRVTCDDCGRTWESAKDCERLCYMDERPRLPTKEQEDAHRERHGEGAGWLILKGEHVFHVGKTCPDMAALRFMGESSPCWPHVNGRPVAGPEGW